MENLLINKSWRKLLEEEMKAPYFKQLETFLASQENFHPKGMDIFRSLNLTSYENVKVVIVGQDPYSVPFTSNGLAFSSEEITPTLTNVFQELEDDLGIVNNEHGNLTSWANQGVLLLNRVLTVETGKPLSHSKKGWETFTSKIISLLNERERGIVFLLWGRSAKRMESLITNPQHHVLKAGHPSPKAVQYFRGNRHFSQVNEILKNLGETEINWKL